MSINVTIEDDDVFEGDEIYYCDITLPSATSARGIQLGSDDVATTTILDDEPGVRVTFAPTSYTVSEDAGNVTLMLVASGPSSEAYSVFVNTRDGSATCELISRFHDYDVSVHDMENLTFSEEFRGCSTQTPADSCRIRVRFEWVMSSQSL